MEQSTAKVPNPTASPAALGGLSKPNYSAFNAFGTPPPPQPSSPKSSMFQQQQQQAMARSAQPTAVDPFAALHTPIGQASPQQNHAVAASKSLFDFAQPTAQVPTASHDDDEWNFSSATLPENDTIMVTNSNVKIDLRASRPSHTEPIINLEVMFSNNVAHAITELTFQVAVTKVSISVPKYRV